MKLDKESYQFFMFDTDFDSFLTGNEYRNYLFEKDKKKGRATRSLQEMNAKVDRFFKKFDKNLDNLITYAEFSKGLEYKSKK